MIPIFVLKGSSPKIGDKHLEIYTISHVWLLVSQWRSERSNPVTACGWRGKCDCYQADSVRSSGDENQILQHDFVSHEAIGQPTSSLGVAINYKRWTPSPSLFIYVYVPANFLYEVHGLEACTNDQIPVAYLATLFQNTFSTNVIPIKKHCIFSSPLVEVYFSDLQMYVVTRLLIVH